MSVEFLPSLRVTVFVPKKAAADYIEKVQDHIPAFLGNYDRVLWISEPSIEGGIEQFRPLEGSNPSQGGSYETVREPSVKVEFSLPDDRPLCKDLIDTILVPSHPWEEPVILIADTQIASYNKKL